MVIPLVGARHVCADGASVALGMVFVLDAHLRGKCGDWEASDVTGSKYVATAARPPEGVDDDAVRDL